MTLKDVGGSAAAQEFSASGEGDDFVQEFRRLSWTSFNFNDEAAWSVQTLTNFAFRLSGGRFTTCGSAGAQATLKVLEEDENLYESLANTDADYLLDVIKELYLGSFLAVGGEGGVSISVLCDRVNRCWSSRSDDVDGRGSVARSLDGFTLREASGSAMRPLASLLNRLGLRSKLGAFAGSGVQAATTKKRLVNFFEEFAPPSTVNGLICLAASPDDGMSLLTKNWTEEAIRDLEIADAVAVCNALGLSPTSSSSAPRFLALSFKDNMHDHSTENRRVSSQDPQGFQGAPSVPREGRPVESQKATPGIGHQRPEPLRKEVTRPAPIRIPDLDENCSSDSEHDEPTGTQKITQKLAKLLSPTVQTARSGQSLSAAAAKVVETLPAVLQAEFTEMVDENRNTCVSKKDLELLREVFIANKTTEEMFLSRRPLPDHVLKTEGSKTLTILPLYQSTRLGFATHLSILSQELTVRTAGGRSLETSLAEKQALMKDESIRSEHSSIGELLVLLLDEMHPQGVLSLRTAERMMRRLVGLEIAAEKKGKSNLPLQKSLAELSEFMGTGMRVSAAVQSQLP